VEKGRCAKREVIGMIRNGNACWVGSNWCESPQEVCPRSDGEGYDKCQSVCKQHAHAEIDALERAGDKSNGAYFYLIGHDHICEQCLVALCDAGIKRIWIIGDDDEGNC